MTSSRTGPKKGGSSACSAASTFFTREALAIPVKRRLNAMDALDGCCESFNSKLSDELLNREIFYSLAEARPVAGGQMR